MKTLILITTLLTSQISVAQTAPADLICRTQHMGEDQRQLSVYIFNKRTHLEATLTTTSNNGLYAPMVFKNIVGRGLNGEVVYMNVQDPTMGIPQFFFQLSVGSNYKGTLNFGNYLYKVSCAKARDPIIAL